METIALVILFAFMVVSAICVSIGLDPKKWFSWLLGLYGFLSGFLASFIRPEGGDIGTRLVMGAIFAFIILFGGATRYQQRQFYTKERLQATKDRFEKLVSDAKKKREQRKNK